MDLIVIFFDFVGRKEDASIFFPIKDGKEIRVNASIYKAASKKAACWVSLYISSRS